MNSLATRNTLFLGLALGASAFAQTPPPGAPLPAAQGSATTQTSRIRAFNPGPKGEVHSLYLANGSVVDLSPDLGRQIGALAHRGARIKVTGIRSNVNGQKMLAANSVTINAQTFVSRPEPLAALGAPGGAMRKPLPPPGPRAERRGPGPQGQAVAGLDRPTVGPQAGEPGPPPPPAGGPHGPARAAEHRNGPPPPPQAGGPRPPRPAEGAPPASAPAPALGQPAPPAGQSAPVAPPR